MKFSSEPITGRKNPVVMLASSLSEKKYREKHALMQAEGKKLAEEAFAAGAPITHVLLKEGRSEEYLPLLSAYKENPAYRDTEIFILSEGCFDKVSTEKSPEGIILLIKTLDILKKCNKILYEVSNQKAQGVLLLSGIRDPGNLGTILRSALAFGCDTVMLSSDCCDVCHPRVARGSMGALFRLSLAEAGDLSSAVKDLRASGRRVFAAELRAGAKSLFEIAHRPEDVFLIGNEGHGIPKELSLLCDGSVYLPISPSSESLNAAIAASILLWERFRKEQEQ